MEWKLENKRYNWIILYIYIDSLENSGNKTTNPTTTETEYTLGGSSDYWSHTGTIDVSWLNGTSNNILGLQGYNDGGSISVNFVKIKIYYTEVVGPANAKIYKGLAIASIKTKKGLA